jgi:hypothetical protein
MATFISDDIQAENGVTATTSTISTISATTISGTTLFGNGSNLTNVNTSPAAPVNSIQFNNNGTLSGSTSLLYSGGTLFYTGTTRLNGSFFRTNSPSVKQVHQWGGTINAGTTPGIVWTTMPAGVTTWLHTTTATLTGDATYLTDFTEYTECRLFTSMQVAGAGATTLIRVQFSTDNVSYSELVSLTIGNTTGAKDTNWTSIPVAARTFIYIRLVGQNGNATANPRFSPPILLIR